MITIPITLEIKPGQDSVADHITVKVGEIILWRCYEHELRDWQRAFVAAALTARSEQETRLAASYGRKAGG